MLYSIRALQHCYGDRVILDIPELDIEAEKIYTLIGPNGAGKTTLLNILAFLERPSRGQIQYCSSAVDYRYAALHQLRRRVVLVDQYPILFTGTVWKNIDFGLRIRKIARSRREEIIKEVLEMVGMQAFANADARRLSGGENKRVALARALALQPEVLLCDEPTANVDTQNQEILLKILEQCNTRGRLSLLFATHYFSQAQRLADKTIILQNGQISDTARDNTFHVRRIESDADNDIWQVGEVHRLVTAKKLSADVPDKAEIFIDPRRITLSAGSSPFPERQNLWTGEICRIEKENDSIRVTVGTGLRLDLLLSTEIYAAKPYGIGEHVTLAIGEDCFTFSFEKRVDGIDNNNHSY